MKTWLRLSLFCKKPYWHLVMAQGIEPFVSNMGGITAYEICFSYLSGENIRLALCTLEKNAPEIALMADEHFKAFFKNAKLPGNEVRLPVNGIFMPFPANTVQYGLFTPWEADSSTCFTNGLSKIMMDALKTETIDDDTILTFAFYLHVSLLTVIGIDKIDLVNSCDSAITAHQAKFAENRLTLFEIRDDIVNGAEGNPFWLKEWVLLCTNEVKRIPGTDVMHSYNRIAGRIYRQLGMDNDSTGLLRQFLTGVFNVEIG